MSRRSAGRLQSVGYLTISGEACVRWRTEAAGRRNDSRAPVMEIPPSPDMTLSPLRLEIIAMQKRTIFAAATIAVAAVAMAENAHFLRWSGSITNDGSFAVSFKEVGLGSGGGSITYSLTAGQGTEFKYQCYTKSNNTPQGEPNFVHPSDLTVYATLPIGRNGQITGSIAITPQPEEDCQGGGLKLCLVQVTYASPMTLTDTNNGVSVTLNGDTREFLNNQGNPTLCE